MMLKTTTLTNTEITRHIMGLAVIVALLLGAAFGLNGQTSQAITDFGIALFFVFVYSNPDLVLKNMSDVEKSSAKVQQKKFLWCSLLLGLLAVAWEAVYLTG
jgi:hypothetical protein